MNDTDKVLTYEEAKQLCMKAFDGGALYGSESMRYGVNATAYDWNHWLQKNESLFKPKPTVEQGCGRMSKPSDGMTFNELRHEFDWISDFHSRMAKRIRGDADVHNLVDYVTKLEAENARLKQELESVGTAAYLYGRTDLADENAKLRELVKGLMGHVMHPPCEGCIAEMNCDCSDLTQCDEWLFFEADARRLGIEVDE